MSCAATGSSSWTACRRWNLPTDRPRPAAADHARGGEKTRRLSGRLSHAIQRLGRQEGATPFMTLFGRI